MIRHALGRAPRAAGLAARSLAVPLRAPAARQQQTASLRSWAAAPLGPARQPALLCQRRCFGDAGTLEIKTPDFGAESITEGTLMEWQKQVGDFCAKGDILAVIETDKVSVEVKAVENGTVQELLAKADDTVEVGQVLAVLKLGGTPPPKAAAAPAAKPAAAPAAPTPKPSALAAAPAAPAAAAQPAAAAPAAPKPAPPVPRPPAKGGKAAVPFWEVAFRKHWYG